MLTLPVFEHLERFFLRRFICRGVVAALMLTVPAAAFASGELDTTFGHDGRAITGFAGRSSGASAVAIQADGRIVAAGGASGGGLDSRFALARYTRKGRLDPSFGAGGRVNLPSRGGQTYATDVAIQANRKIVVVGSDRFKFGVARLKRDGTLDRSFGGDGQVITGFDGSRAVADAVAIQANGKIVVAGTNYPGCGGDDSHFALARYRRDGTLDPTFGDGGMVITEVGSFCVADTFISALAIQDDGKIVAVGSSGGAGFVLARYNHDGMLDPTFDGDGLIATAFPDSLGVEANDVALESDGMILAAGWAAYETADGFADRFALARYLSDGTLDTTFSGDGMVSTGFSEAGYSSCPCGLRGARAYDVAIQADGEIVALGTASGRRRRSWFALARYDEGGTLDQTFGGDGRVTSRFGRPSLAYGLAIQENQRIVAAGTIRRKFGLARYLP
jgi:uncharacterized delta-60 repeat protein